MAVPEAVLMPIGLRPSLGGLNACPLWGVSPSEGDRAALVEYLPQVGV